MSNCSLIKFTCVYIFTISSFESTLGVNLNLSQSTPAKVQIETRINKIYSLEQCDKISDELTDDIYAMFDTKEFKEKPKPPQNFNFAKWK